MLEDPDLPAPGRPRPPTAPGSNRFSDSGSDDGGRSAAKDQSSGSEADGGDMPAEVLQARLRLMDGAHQRTVQLVTDFDAAVGGAVDSLDQVGRQWHGWGCRGAMKVWGCRRGGL